MARRKGIPEKTAPPCLINTPQKKSVETLGYSRPSLRDEEGQILAALNLWSDLFVNESTVRRYVDLLTRVFMVRQLRPWFENLGKRQVKAPKVYVRDTGLLHVLLGIGNRRDLEHHPKVGASWEGYAVEEVLKTLRPDEAYSEEVPHWRKPPLLQHSSTPLLPRSLATSLTFP